VMDAGGSLVSNLFVPAGSVKTVPKGEAQRLAAALLMPPNPLREMHKAGASLNEMAGVFLTSERAVMTRLRTLCLEPPPEPVAQVRASETIVPTMGAGPQG
jgi:hypothetical protein